MSQTLYTKPVNGMPPPPPVEQHTIHVHPTGSPNFQFLLKDKFLGEFKTEVDKARVRENLGIPDNYSYNWGHIGGAIENQADLMRILNNILNKQRTLDDQIAGISSSVNSLIGKDDQSAITTQELYRQFLDLKINVAQNSTDITSLITGGDTSLSLQVSKNLSDIERLKTQISSISNYDDTAILNRINALEQRPTVDSNLTNRVNILESKINDESLHTSQAQLQAQITILQNQITALQQEIGGNVTTGITASRTSINATPNSSNISITITASYSKLKDQDVTELCTIQVEDETVVTWENGYIIINSELEESKSTNVNFTYDGFTISIPVNVIVIAPTPVYKQYVGWAQSSSQIFNNSNFECDSVAKKWINAPSIGMAPYYFFIITTQTISTISSAVGPYTLSDLYDGQLTSTSGQVYNVYKIGPARNTDAEITITL